MSSAAAHQGSRRPFGSRLADAMDDHGPLCVGIDPHPNLLEAWGLADSAAGLREFALRTIDAVGGHVAAVKPQSAFFERHGSAGIAVLEETLAALRDVGTLSVLDVKRGDIGSTMAGYAQAYLSDDTPLAADSITVSPYLGYGSLTPALNLAEANGSGVFVLALTSNPEGAGVQHAVNEDQAVAAGIVEGVTASNAQASGEGRLGSIGLVIGATVGGAVSDLGIDLQRANGPLLAPGVAGVGVTYDFAHRAEHVGLGRGGRADAGPRSPRSGRTPCPGRPGWRPSPGATRPPAGAAARGRRPRRSGPCPARPPGGRPAR